MTTKTMKIEDLANWSEPKRVETKNGPRDLRKARPSQQFWAAWKQSKAELKEAGVSVSKRSGDWEAYWWLPIDADEQRELDEARELSRAKDADVEVPCPEGLEFYPFQKAGIAYAARKFAGGQRAVAICDQMGLGKSPQSVGVINADEGIRKVLVVVPASLRVNWKRELERWLTRDLSISIVNGGKAEDWKAADVTIINYDVVGKHRDRIDRHGPYDLLILDENHYLKNQDAQRTRAVYGYKTKKGEVKREPIAAKRTLALSGTPIVNRPVELWSFLQFADPEGLGCNFFKFAKRYCDAQQTRWGWDFSGASNLEELQRKLRERLMVRRLKADVLTELPPKRRQVVELPANGAAGAVSEELRIWESHRDYIEQLERELAELEVQEEADPNLADDVRKRLGKAKAVAFEEMSKARHAVAVAKAPKVAEAVREELEEIESVVVFAHHKDVVKILENELADLGVVTITGETPMDERQAAVDAFQAGEARVFIGNIQAAGVGLTLTRAADVRFAELDWVPGNLDQAEDRCHRIGQVGSVLVKHYVLEGSLDSYMVEKIIAKQGVIRAALDDPIEKVEEVLRTGKGAQSLLDSIETAGIGVSKEWANKLREATGETAEAVRERSVEVTAEEEPEVPTEQREVILAGLRQLAGVCDGARELDGCGFNKHDSRYGKSLAAQSDLSPRQAEAGRKLLRKYRRQLPDGLLEAAGIGGAK